MFFLYLILWFIFSMRLSLGIAMAGIVFSALIYRFACKHMDHQVADDYRIMRKLFLIFQYAFILVWETAKSVIGVLRIVFSRTIKVKPQIMYFRTAVQTDPVLAVLANSITLMPGSVVVALEEGRFCIHCLDPSLVENIQDSLPVRHLRKIEE